MNTQPEALRHADTLEHWNPGDTIAAELRRLHAANIDCVDHFSALKADRDELLEALKVAQGHIRFGQDLEQVDLLLSALIAKANGE